MSDSRETNTLENENAQQGLRRLRADLIPEFTERISDWNPEPGDPDAHGPGPDVAQALVEEAFRLEASDIHLEPQTSSICVRFRINGEVCDVAHLTREQGKVLINQFKAIGEVDPVIQFTPKDAHTTMKCKAGPIDLRMAFAPCLTGQTLAIRVLDPHRLELGIEDLGLSQDQIDTLREWANTMSGLFLISGPTGVGKTTTAYAMLHELKAVERAILTLEDPIEYRMDGITQIQVDELHHLDFAEGIKSLLRLDPDYMMIGEVRDAESASAAAHAAVIGHGMQATIHARDAVSAVTVLRNWKLSDQEIGDALAIVLCQRLVRQLCPECRKPDKPNADELRWLKSVNRKAPRKIWRPVGCGVCHDFGYIGRFGLFELWRVDESDRAAILAHTDEYTMRAAIQKKGQLNMLDDGLGKVAEGITSLDELRKYFGGGATTSKRASTPKKRAAAPNKKAATPRKKAKSSSRAKK